jgi:hypothetical protein
MTDLLLLVRLVPVGDIPTAPQQQQQQQPCQLQQQHCKLVAAGLLLRFQQQRGQAMAWLSAAACTSSH